MKTALLSIFAIASLAVCVWFFLRAVRMYRSTETTHRIFSSIQTVTIGVFLSVVLVFIPIYYTSYDFGDSYHFIRPLLIAVHNTLRIFILDGDFDVIVNSVADQSVAVRVCFSSYAAFLYVIAPILTFGNVLSLFKNVGDVIRYKWHKNEKHFIFSQLNPKSIALAKSIFETQENAILVFTDVYAQDEEQLGELLPQARRMHAICLKTKITKLDFLSKKGNVEIFLMDDNEAENVGQAVKITTELNKKCTKYDVKIFVFSTERSAPYILDSLKYDKLLEHAHANNYTDACFKLRRIDEKQQLIRNTIPKMKLFDLADRHDKTLSVMIVGFGSYGMEFFKTLVWYCQFEGYRLQINVFDKQARDIAKLIERDCPDLLKNNCSPIDGDAQYDIQLFSNIDALTSDIDALLLYNGTDTEKKRIAERLGATDLAIVALGDDDSNIEVSVHLRSLFDRVNGIRAKDGISWEDEPVDIYSVVYDDEKSEILCGTPGESELVNHKGVPYHIHFIGALSSQFDYHNIYDPEIEGKALAHHIGWVDIEKRIYNEWKAAANPALEQHDWYAIDNKIADAVVTEERKKYEQYEYYRLSSIAKMQYQEGIRACATTKAKTTCLGGGDMQTCQCANCVRRKRSEHMRWNAYTRVVGYCYGKKRSDRAHLHDNLCGWDELSELDKLKD